MKISDHILEFNGNPDQEIPKCDHWQHLDFNLYSSYLYYDL